MINCKCIRSDKGLQKLTEQLEEPKWDFNPKSVLEIMIARSTRLHNEL